LQAVFQSAQHLYEKREDPDPDPLTNGFGSGRPKNMRIRIRISNTGKNNVVYPRLPEPANQKTQESASGDDTNSGG
jgi:hypothetical protein